MTVPALEELKALPQWVAWRHETKDGKPTKVPYIATNGSHASTTNPGFGSPTRCRLRKMVRRSALVIVATVLVACGSGGATPLASGAPPSPVAASPAPSPVQPIVLSGTNSKVTDPMEIPKGNYRVSWQASGAHNFIVSIQGQENSTLVNEILPNPDHGEVLFSSAGGQFIVAVEARQATWQITFTWLSP